VTQLGFLYEEEGQDIFSFDHLIQPSGPEWQISPTASALTGITREMCEAEGVPMAEVMDTFVDYCALADVIVCHNVSFDSLLMKIEAIRLANDPEFKPEAIFENAPHVCTMLAATPICKLPKLDKRVGWKWPKLEEAIWHFFGEKLDGAHNAMVDILATQRLFRHLCDLGAMDAPFEKVGLEAPRYG
jgi:DNA polymerase-3 subunit epsilon